jgi:hypothetical protein
MFSGVKFTIRQANGVWIYPTYEVSNEDSLTTIISETFRLCREQGALLANWEVA